MKILLLAILTTVASCSHFNHSRNPSSENEYEVVNCANNFCVGDEIFSYHEDSREDFTLYSTGRKIEDLTGKITEIQVSWIGRDEISLGEDVYTHAIIQTSSGKKKKVNLRDSVKLPIQDNCVNSNGQKFCAGDEVMVYQNIKDETYYAELSRDLKVSKTSIFAVFPNEDRFKSAHSILTYSSDDKTMIANNPKVSIYKGNQCFDKENKICLNKTYDNGLGSNDTIVAYTPTDTKDESFRSFIIKAGDLNQYRIIHAHALLARIDHKYVKILNGNNSVSLKLTTLPGTYSNKTKKEAIKYTKAICAREFLGQGVVDSKSPEPKVEICQKEGDSIKCYYSYGLYCVHKKLAK